MKKQSKVKRLLGGVHPAVISVWAALMAAAHMLPAIVLVGVGGTMSVSAILIPLAGIFFGPVAGPICVAIGQSIGYLIAPSGAWLGVFTPLIGVCTSVCTGLTSRGKGPVAVAISTGAVLLWYTNSIGRKAWLFGLTFGCSGVVFLLISCFICKKFLLSNNVVKKAISVWCVSAGGMFTSSLYADVVTLILYKTPAISWKVLAFTAPVERFIFATAATIIAVPLLLALPKIGIFVGPQPDNASDAEEEPETDAV